MIIFDFSDFSKLMPIKSQQGAARVPDASIVKLPLFTIGSGVSLMTGFLRWSFGPPQLLIDCDHTNGIRAKKSKQTYAIAPL